MLNWHDWAVFCANATELEKQTILQQRFITLEGTEVNEALLPVSHYAHTITGSEIPQFTSLAIKDLQRIGVCLKKIC